MAFIAIGLTFGATAATAFTTGLIATTIIGGAVVGGIGQLEAGKAAEEQGKAEQEMMNYNAKLKEREAQAEIDRARAEAIRFDEEGDALMGTQKAKLAIGGVLASEGTPAMLLEQTKIELEADRRTILQEGFTAGSFREAEAAGLRFQGRSAATRGKNMKTASMYQAGGSLLSGLGAAGAYRANVGGSSSGGYTAQQKATLAKY